MTYTKGPPLANVGEGKRPCPQFYEELNQSEKKSNKNILELILIKHNKYKYLQYFCLCHGSPIEYHEIAYAIWINTIKKVRWWKTFQWKSDWFSPQNHSQWSKVRCILKLFSKHCWLMLKTNLCGRKRPQTP